MWIVDTTARQGTYPAPAFSVEDAAGTRSASTSFGTEKKYCKVENYLQNQRDILTDNPVYKNPKMIDDHSMVGIASYLAGKMLCKDV